MDARDIAAQRQPIGGELLAQADRRRVLQVGAARLHDAVEFAPLRLEGGSQLLQHRQRLAHHQHRRDAHRRREGVVGGLRHVDMVVGMRQLVVAALAAENLDGAVGKHLIRVHVVRGASARLIDIHHKLVAPLTRQHLIGGLDDSLCDVRVEAARLHIRERRRLLHQHRRLDHRRMRVHAADGIILDGALRLHAI